MMQQDVAAADGGKDVFAVAPESGGNLLREGCVSEVFEVIEIGEPHQPSEVDGARNVIHLAIAGRATLPAITNLFVLTDGFVERLVRVLTNLQADGVGLASFPQAFFDHAEHVVGLLLEDFQVAIPCDAERAAAFHIKAAEKLGHAGGDQVLEHHECMRITVVHRYEAW